MSSSYVRELVCVLGRSFVVVGDDWGGVSVFGWDSGVWCLGVCVLFGMCVFGCVYVFLCVCVCECVSE